MRCTLAIQLFAVSLTLLAGIATAQVPATLPAQQLDAGGIADSDWVAYRNVYREMIQFEKYGKPKQFLQNQLRITPLDKATSTDGLRLTIVSKSITIQLPLDSLARAQFPLSKALFDDNAELRLNRKAGQFEFGPRLSIALRAEGVYEASDLRTACEQALGYLHYLGQSWANGKQCVGVQFSYPKGDAEAQVRIRKSDQTMSVLAAREGGAFADDIVLGFKIMVYRFADWPQAGQILTRTTPLAIAPLIEN